MRRALLLVLGGVAGLAAAVVPALAATSEVAVVDFGFRPAVVTIAVGDTVRWNYAEGQSFHNVQFTDGSYEEPVVPVPPGPPLWPVERTFDQPGEFSYICRAHPDSMTGKVVVTTGDPAPPPPTQTQTSPPVEAPPSARFRRARARFCIRCPRPGVVLLVEASGPVTVEGRLARGGRRFGSVRFEVDEDTERVRFTRTRAGRRLERGRYVLRIAGETIRFRVTR